MSARGLTLATDSKHLTDAVLFARHPMGPMSMQRDLNLCFDAYVFSSKIYSL